MTQTKRFNIKKRKTYMQNGKEKTIWQNVGILTMFTNEDGSESGIVDIPVLSQDFQVFPYVPRKTPKEEATEEITVEDIPF